jgi:hypothetical protein
LREYNLKYLGLLENIFRTKDIDDATEKGRKLTHVNFTGYTQKSVGLDLSLGISNFGVCIADLVDVIVNVIVNVLHAEEYQRPDFNEMIAITVKLLD